MFKKINMLVLCLLIGGCASNRSVPEMKPADTLTAGYGEMNFLQPYQDDENFRVGMLLPLSGKAAKQGQGLKNAAMMALDDVNNPKLIVQFYDTKSTPSGARTAVENALNQRSRLIVGPLMSTEVQAISDQTRSHNVPVIAFSTSQEVLQPTVYTLGLLIDEQVERIVSFAAKQGRQRFALLVPDNKMGMAVAKAAVAAAQENGAEVTRIAFYPPNTTDFANIVKQLTDYGSRSYKLNNMKATLKAQANKGDAAAAKKLKQLKTTNSAGDVDFDAVLIPEYGAKLKSIISMFGYYDVYAPQVKFLGTSLWENTNLNKETMIVHSWYPTLSRYQSAYFSNKYSQLFGERPSSLDSFGYDAIALASALAQQDSGDLNDAITNHDGYIGINGAFRLFGNGTNQHSLDIMEIRPQGDTTIDSAPKKFDDDGLNFYSNDNYMMSTPNMPRIFGKDPGIVESQIFGYPVYESAIE